MTMLKGKKSEVIEVKNSVDVKEILEIGYYSEVDLEADAKAKAKVEADAKAKTK